MSSAYFAGPPGITAPVTANFKALFTHRSEAFLAQGRRIDPTKSRDPSNTTDVGVLQPGLLMGRITATGYYAPAVIGLTGAALATGGTTLTLASAAIGTEIVRRFGASGTFKLTGPPTAAGTVRTSTVTYSAVVDDEVTITALGANEVQRVDMDAASTGGSLRLSFTDPTTGERITTAAISWNGTDATYLASINSALDTASGVVGGIVATAIPATDTDLGFLLTFSGTGYAAMSHDLVSVATFPTSSAAANVSRSTTGSSGAFVSGSWIQPADGSEDIKSILPDWDAGIRVTDETGASISGQIDFPKIPVAGELDAAQIINFPADTAMRTYLEAQLREHGNFTLAGTGSAF